MIARNPFMFKRKLSKIVAVFAVIFFLLFLFGFLNANFRRVVEESVVAVFSRKAATPLGSTTDCSLTCVVRQEDANSLIHENETLRRALGLSMSSALRPLTIAKIVGMSPERGRGLLFMDKGVNSGVRTGDIAYILNKVLIGRVTEVYDDFAVLETPLTRGIRISARLSSGGVSIPAAGIFVNETGFGGGALDLISKNTKVGQGDLVLTNGEDGAYPAGFLIGSVSKAKLPAAGYFWNIGVEIPWEPGTLMGVLVFRNPLK